jgi:hypothetical protein
MGRGKPERLETNFTKYPIYELMPIAVFPIRQLGEYVVLGGNTK